MVQSVITTECVENDGQMDKVQQQQQQKSPPFVYVLTALSAIGGFLFGYDTGVVSGAMLLIRTHFQIENDLIWQELIVSATIGAAWVFALVGGFLTDILGRKPVIIIASFVFTIGAVIMGASPTKEVLLGGRIIVGIGIGLTSMTVPMYIAEVSSPHNRGTLVTVNNLFITGGQFVASVICGVFSSNEINGWRFMLGLAGIPSLIQFIGFLGMPESPRWLIKKGQNERAITILRTIRSQGADIDSEFEMIKQSCEEAAEDAAVNGSSVLVEVFRTPTVRRALIVGSALQIFQQLAGINTVMYYSATIIQMSGVRSTTMAVWLSAVVASVNFVFTFLGLYLVEKVGRRPLTLGSLGGVILSLIVLAVGFQLSAVTSPAITFSESSPFAKNDSCSSFKSCTSCINDDSCGFCFNLLESGIYNGSCIAVASVDDSDVSHYGRCSNSTFFSSAESTHLSWDYGFCPADYQWLPILGLCLYLVFFAPGMGPMPWTINSEIYPLWARSTCYAIATSFNWMFNLVVSMTFLTLTDVLTKYGAFYLYSGIALVGLLVFYFTVPETRGKSLEEVEGLFAKPFCCGGNDVLMPVVITSDRTIQYVQIRGLNIRDRQDSNDSGDDT